MPRQTKAKAAADTSAELELVSPDGERKRTVSVGSGEEVKLRFDGYLPVEQAQLEAPERPSGAQVERTVGTNSSEG